MMTDASVVHDLGEMDGAVLAFGGPYGNLEATTALLALAEQRGIPPHRVICTGDVVAYCADPLATVQRLRASGISVLMGNCEESLAAGILDCGCGFESGTACDALAMRWFAHCNATIDDNARRWMAALPRRMTFSLNGRRFAVVHGAPGRINRFVFASTARAAKMREIAEAGTDAVIAGHAGIPFVQTVGRHLWINAGSIGLPANDGTPRVWWTLIEPVEGDVRVTINPLAYDHAGAAEKMRARGLPEGYAAALESGLWPSLSVLPAVERRATGRALRFSPKTWGA